MNAERRIRILAAVMVLAAIFAAAGEDKPAASPVSLIRWEWLPANLTPPAPPKRDIFSPRNSPVPAEDRFRDDAVPSEAGSERPNAGGKAVESQPPALELRFIGWSYGVAQKRLVGLVLLDGTAAAVAEGETLANGFTVTRITRREIEVRGPDGKTLTFALEGGER